MLLEFVCLCLNCCIVLEFVGFRWILPDLAGVRRILLEITKQMQGILVGHLPLPPFRGRGGPAGERGASRFPLPPRGGRPEGGKIQNANWTRDRPLHTSTQHTRSSGYPIGPCLHPKLWKPVPSRWFRIGVESALNSGPCRRISVELESDWRRMRVEMAPDER